MPMRTRCKQSNRIFRERRTEKWDKKGDMNIPVNPVRDVQCPIGTEGSQIVRRDVLRLPCALQHEQLRKDSHRLKPD